MQEKQWKLNEDMHKSDCIFDPITFEDIILAAHCNERVLNENAIKRVAREILESRLEDFEYLIQNNIDEIIAEAKKGRN
jgi:ferredoxin-fold anticodon binding domain-containing protein